MYKMIIVDDEVLERRAIQHIVKKHALPIKIIGQASNGVEAVKLAKTLEPDIVIMDIKMPGMDGLEATEIILSNRPETMVIILSAYDEFNYAKKAVKLGAFDYVLKPARTEEIIQALQKLLETLKKKIQLKSEYDKIKDDIEKAKPYIQLSFIYNLISGHVGTEDIHMQANLLEIKTLPQMAMVIGIDGLDEKASKMEVEVTQQKVLKIINECVGDMFPMLLVPMGYNKMVLLLTFQDSYQQNTAKKLAYKIAEKIRRSVAIGKFATVTVGIGRYYDDIATIRQSYLQARKAFKMGTCILGGNQVIHFDDLIRNEDQIYPVFKEDILHNHIINGEWQDVRKNLQGILKQIIESEESIVFKRTRIAEIVISLSRTAIEEGANREKILRVNADFYTKFVMNDYLEDIVDYVLEIVKEFEDAVIENHQTYTAKIIYAAQDYIEKNYVNDICMKDVAEAVNLSPHYFSRLFKKETGVTFIEYITKIRLNKAKKLLHDPSLTINEVAQKAGYIDASYFSRLFKKHENLAPSEYRNKINETGV